MFIADSLYAHYGASGSILCKSYGSVREVVVHQIKTCGYWENGWDKTSSKLVGIKYLALNVSQY